MKLDPSWGRCRRLTGDKLTAAKDIILYCTEPRHDKLFAAKYGMSEQTITKIRLGYTWRSLRKQLERKYGCGRRTEESVGSGS